MSDDAVYALVRSTLTDLAEEARPVDLVPETLRRLRRRTVSMSIGAVCAVAALLIGVPVAVAAGADGGTGHSTPSASVARSAPAPTGRPESR